MNQVITGGFQKMISLQISKSIKGHDTWTRVSFIKSITMARDQLNSFYVHLPSNEATSLDENTLGKYTTHLARPILLDGAWEVALAEISYTVSWYNLTGNNYVSILSFGHELSGSSVFGKSFVRGDKTLEDIEEVEEEYGEQSQNDSTLVQTMITSTPIKHAIEEESVHFVLPTPKANESATFSDAKLARLTNSHLLYKTRIRPGHYTAKELIDTINNVVFHELLGRGEDPSTFKSPQLEIDKDGFVSGYTGKRINPATDKSEDIFINLSGNVAKLLGFYWDNHEEWKAVSTNFGRKYKVTSSSHFDPRGGIFHLFVYSDIIRTVHVGESMSNLLRIVEVPNNTSFGQHINISHLKPQYKRLSSNEISSIAVNIKDDNENELAFRFGTSIVTLHFRKISS